MRAEEVKAELDRILAYGDMQSSSQMSRFLSFVVEQALAGRESQIKERMVAIRALDRGEGFDPRIDPIVRVVAGKLRRTLERYYFSEGASNDLRIVLPKGSYVPRFLPRDEAIKTSVALATAPTDLMLRTKLHRPPQTSDLLNRKALLEQLNRHRDLPLTLVSAPAGYGKSTLVSAWLEELDVSSAWLSLDEKDNDLRYFLGGIVAAVQTAFPKAAEATQTVLAAPALPPVRVLSRQLLNDLDNIEDAFVLALDDYHVIHETAVHELLAELLRHPPRPMHLALLTREDPPLPLDRLRGQGKILELSLFDLRFTFAETVEFLCKALAVSLSDSAIRAITERLEGWPAGLRLLAQSVLWHQEDPERAIAELRGDVNAVRGYLVSEVFSALPPMTADCLLRVSILDRFCDPLCERLCDQDRESATCERDGQSLTEWLQSQNLFLISLDSENRWFRFHHLFQSLLRDRLEQRLGDDEIATLHARASAWFEDQGLTDEAIHYALKSGDPDGAADILTRDRFSILNSDRWYELRKWLDRLPEVVAEKRAGILLAKCWIASLDLRIADIQPLLDRAEALIDDDESTEAPRGEIDFFSSIVAYWQGEGELSLMCATKALEQLPVQFEAARADAEIYLGLSQQMCGRQELALQTVQRRARENTDRQGLVFTRQLATICFIHYLDAKLQRSIRAAEQFRTVAQEGRYTVTDLWASYLIGSCHFQMLDLEEAVVQLGRVARNKYVFDPPFSLSCLTGLAIAHQAMQRPCDADEAMRELFDFARDIDGEATMAIAESSRARLALLRGDHDTAERWLRGYDAPLDAPAMLFFLEVPFITRCRVLLALGTKPTLGEARSELDHAWDTLRSLHNNFQSIEVGVLRALALQGLSRDDEALLALEDTVALAAAGGWVRPFAEPGRPVIDLLSRLVERDSGGAYARWLLAKLREPESGREQE